MGHKAVVGKIIIFGEICLVTYVTTGFILVTYVTDYIVARPFIFVLR